MCQLVVTVGHILVVCPWWQTTDNVFECWKTLINRFCFFKLVDGRLRLVYLFASCKVHKGNLWSRFLVGVKIRHSHDQTKNKVRSGRAVIHGSLWSFTLGNTKLVSLKRLLDRTYFDLRHVQYLHHPSNWVFSYLQLPVLGFTLE